MDARVTHLDFLAAPSGAERRGGDARSAPEPPGEGALRAIRDALRRMGGEAGPVDNWQGEGWVFSFSEGDARLSCLLHWRERWCLRLWAERRLLDRLRGRSLAAALTDGGERVRTACRAAHGVGPAPFAPAPAALRPAA